jgi:hypothetical protein
MKTISNIKQEYARNMGYVDWNEVLDSTDLPVELEMHYDRLLVMVAREALKNASENVEIGWKINKQSILDENNIPEL